LLTGTLRDERQVDAALPAIRSAPGPVLHIAKVRTEPLPPKDGAYLKDRFRDALLGIKDRFRDALLGISSS
jgi:hypothetical protein